MIPNRRDYLFVDGAYLREIVRDFTRAIFDAAPPEIDWSALSGNSMADSYAGFLRTFYYDCPPKEANCENPEDRDTSLAALAAFDSKMDVIGRTDGFHVFRGVTAGKTRQRQKQVDVKIAVDMLMHTLSGTMDSATLLAGDQDFIPVIEALVRAGMYVRVLYEKSSASRDLLQSADEALEITHRILFKWCSTDFRNEHQLPEKAELVASDTDANIASSWAEHCTGETLSGQRMSVVFRPDKTDWMFCYYREVDMLDAYFYRDPLVLQRYVEKIGLGYEVKTSTDEYASVFKV